MPVANVFFISALLFLMPALYRGNVYGGDFPEHKRIGDIALRDLISRDTTTRRFLVDNGFEVLTRVGLDKYVLPTVCPDCASTPDELVGTLIIGKLPGINGRDTAITYGDICGLLANTRRDPFHLLRFLQSATASGRLEFSAEHHDIINLLRGHWKGLDTALIVEDRRHEMVYGTSYQEQLHRIDSTLARDFLPVFPRVDADVAVTSSSQPIDVNIPLDISAVLPAPANYALFHARATSTMAYAHSTSDRTQRVSAILRALITSAVADHFLQDMFASDHHIADCDSTPYDGTLESYGCNEYYRKIGVPFRFRNTEGFVFMYGDGYFDGSQYSYAVRANTTSLRDVLTSYGDANAAVSAFVDVVTRKSDTSTDYAFAFSEAPFPLVGDDEDNAHTLHRSVQGVFYGLSAYAIAAGKNVGYSADATLGLGVGVSNLGFMRSRAAGYETIVYAYPFVTASVGVARDEWFAMTRAGVGIQIFDSIKWGISFGPAINASTFDGGGVSFPAFFDFAFISKPLAYGVGLEFLISTAITNNAPYDYRIGFGFVFF